MSDFIELLGLVALTASAYVIAGLGASLAVGGVSLLIIGSALDGVDIRAAITDAARRVRERE